MLEEPSAALTTVWNLYSLQDGCARYALLVYLHSFLKYSSLALDKVCCCALSALWYSLQCLLPANQLASCNTGVNCNFLTYHTTVRLIPAVNGTNGNCMRGMMMLPCRTRSNFDISMLAVFVDAVS